MVAQFVRGVTEGCVRMMDLLQVVDEVLSVMLLGHDTKVGNGLTVTVTVAVLLQPLPSVPVTV